MILKVIPGIIPHHQHQLILQLELLPQQLSFGHMTVQQMSTQLILSTLMTLTTAILIRFHQLILAMMQTANFIITLMISHLMTNQLALQSLMSLLTTMTAHLKNIQTLNSNQKLLTSVTLLTFHLDTSTTQTRDSTSFLNLQQSLMKTTV